jgi:hypothetical protein
VQVNVRRYGATGNGSTDDTAAINKAIAALKAGYELYFPCSSANIYKTASGLNPITVNNVTVAGQTGCSSVVEILGTGSGITVMQIGQGTSLSSETPITAVAADGSTTFTANLAAIGARTGSYLYLEEANVSSDTTHSSCQSTGSGCIGEVLYVTGYNSSTNLVTVSTAVHQNYTPTCSASYGSGEECNPWVQLIESPTSGVTVQNLNLNGSGTAYYALTLENAVNTTVSNVTTSNVQWSGVAAMNGFNNSFSSMTTTAAGSGQGGNIGGSAVSLSQQGNLSVNGWTLSSLNSSAFGFIPFREANGSFSNISVNSTGTGGGRSIKTNSSAHDTWTNITVTGTQGLSYNGITIEYFSHHVTWNNVSISGLAGTDNAGIAIYGDASNGNYQGNNYYNTFNNCNVSGTTDPALWVLDNNEYTTISGGSWSGSAGVPVLAFGLDAGAGGEGYVYVTGATISGPGTNGIEVDNASSNVCINNTVFSSGTGSSGAIDVTGSNSMGSGNVLNGLSSNLTAGTCTGP